MLTQINGSLAPLTLEIQININHESINGDQGAICIHRNGMITLKRLSGSISSKAENMEINALPITDYLRKEGFAFQS